MLRGLDGGHLKVGPCESYGCTEEKRVSVIAEGGRVLSTESENVRFRFLEVEYVGRRARTLILDIRSVEYS